MRRFNRAAAVAAAAAAALLAAAPAAAQSVVPEQVQLSLTGAPNEMVVSWAVRSSCSAATCRAVVAYSLTNDTSPAGWPVTGAGDVLGSTVLGESQAIDLRITNVRLSGLAANRTYFYLPGGAGSGGPILSFINGRAPRRGADSAPTDLPPELSTPWQGVHAVIADMGLTQAFALGRLLNDSAAGALDAVFHAGDIAYDLFSSSGAVGDGYLRAMQPVAGSVPYFVAPGNHECQTTMADKPNCFVQYLKRFSGLADGAGRASGSGSSLWYSVNVGLVHYVAIDTELWYYYGPWANITAQYEWLQADLMAVNRSITPWVIAYGHKQNWMDKEEFNWLEEILQRGGVDAYFCGHTHNYQRLLPQWGSTVYSSCASSNRRVYRDCPAMATFVVGSAGSRESISLGSAPQGVVTRWLSYALGYVYVVNASHLYVRAEEVADFNGTVIPRTSPVKRVDEVWVTRTAPRPMSLPVVTPTNTPTTTSSASPAASAGAVSATPSPSAAPALAAWSFDGVLNATGGVFAGSASVSLTGTAAWFSGVFTSGVVAGTSAATVTTFPAQGAGNATSGLVACLPTAGYAPQALTVDLQASNTGSKFRVVQYQTAAGRWVDVPSASALLTASNGGVFNSYVVDLSDAVALVDATQACVRIVTVFAPDGSSTYAAAATGSSYSTGSTLRFDNLVVYGAALPSDAASDSPSSSVTPSPAATSASSTASRSSSGSPTPSLPPSPTASRSTSPSTTASVSTTPTCSRSGAPTASATGTATSSRSPSPPATAASTTATPSASPLPVLAAWTFDGALNATSGVFAGSANVSLMGTAAWFSGIYTTGVGAGSSAATVTTFPAQGAGNATSGLVACLPTVGYAPQTLTVDLQASNTGSRHRVVQFQTAAGGWADVPSASALLTASNGGVFNSFTVSLADATVLAGSAWACVRIVTVFAPGGSAYVAAANGSSYTTGSTLRFDNLVVYGAALPTPSNSASPSVTPSATGSAAGTGTATPSAAATPTQSPTGSGTGSATPPPSASRSGTPTGSGTPSSSGTSTRSRSASVAATGTPSASAPPTGTGTGTGTPAATASSSASVAASGTASGTASPPATASASGSASPPGTPSSSAAATSSGTPSASPPGTGSGTATGSAAPTGTGTGSISGSATAAATGTPSASGSGSPPPTSSPSAAVTPSGTVSGSPSVPASPTQTGTKTPLASVSASRTRSRSVSRTASRSATRTRSRSRTRTPTPSRSRKKKQLLLQQR